MLNKTILNPAWVVGFVDGEGTFFISIQKNATMALDYQVQLQFSITQNNRDTELMNKFIEFFGAGNVTDDGPTKKQFRIRDFNQLENVFCLIDEFPLLTQKKLDAQDFRKVHSMMKQGLHLTAQGLEEIRGIKATMNRSRDFN